MKNKTFLKLTLLVLFFVFSCQQEDFAEELQQLNDIDGNSIANGTQITRSSFDDFKGLDVLYQKTVTDQSKSGKGETTGKSGYDFEIDRSRVTQMRIDGNIYYTMTLLGSENKDFSFYNVVVCEYSDKQPEAFLLGYFPDSAYIKGLETGKTTHFTGEFTVKVLDYQKAITSSGCYTVSVPMCNFGQRGHSRGDNCTPAYFYEDVYTVCVFGGEGAGSSPGPFINTNFASGGTSGVGGSSSQGGNIDFVTEPLPKFEVTSYASLKSNLNITDPDQLHYLWANPWVADELLDFIKDSSYSSTSKLYVKRLLESIEEQSVISEYPFVKYPTSKADQYKDDYPKLTQYLKNEIPKIANNQTIINAINDITDAPKDVIAEALKWGKGPEIWIEQLHGERLGAYRGHAQPDLENILYLDIDLVNMLENSQNLETSESLAFLIAVTILHEYVHLGDNLFGNSFWGNEWIESGFNDDSEAGLIFEETVFGDKVFISNAGVVLKRVGGI